MVSFAVWRESGMRFSGCRCQDARVCWGWFSCVSGMECSGSFGLLAVLIALQIATCSVR